MLALKTDIYAVSRLKSAPISVVLRSKTQNILQKEKVSVSEVRFRGGAHCVKELRPLLMKAVFYENRKTFLASRFGRLMGVSKKKYTKKFRIFGVKAKSIGIFYFWIEFDAVWNQIRMKKSRFGLNPTKRGGLDLESTPWCIIKV